MYTQPSVDFYNDLAMQGSLAQDTWAMLADQMESRHLMFGTRPLCTVLRPLFHTPRGWDFLKERTETVLRAFNKAARIMRVDDQLRAQVRLTPDEEYLVRLESGYKTPIPTARLDSFFQYDPDGGYTLNYIEFNGESPAGMAYGDVLADLFMQTPLVQAFEERYHILPLFAQPHLLDALLRIYREWRGNRFQLPRIAIVDWTGVPTTSEFILIQRYFATHGMNIVLCNPDELTFERNQLYALGQPVDFVYKRVLTTELLQRYGTAHPIIRALEAGVICMANPFDCKLLHKKASFSLVSDERNAHLFTARERKALSDHIPWTRLVEERTTIDQHGASIDLLPWASQNRDHLVLKPNDEYGGKGVLIGWESTQESWDATLHQAQSEPFIVQERAVISYEEFPSLSVEGRPTVSQRLVDCDPFLFHGDSVGGCLVRLSSVTLLNVTAGGGSVVPAFVVNPK